MEEDIQLKKAFKELEDLNEKYRKSDRNLKKVKEIIDSYKRDREDFENKTKLTFEEIELLQKRLTDGKIQELEDFKHVKKFENIVKITNRRIKQFEELLIKLNEKSSLNSDVDTNNSLFDDNMEKELILRIKNCKERMDVLVKDFY
ncbi:uncharacterized protein [Onthophagus taurus]|uniref:uncharacterized protein n=1 Tax=Onthophagus taurus TaxID=166361 RepID=UPI0039BE8ADB